jgi:hypothetical protein
MYEGTRVELNPYESPRDPATSTRSGWPSRRMMFWSGIGLVGLSMGVLAERDQVYMESKAKGVDRAALVSILDSGGIAGIVIGGLVWAISPLFPAKRRRRLWGANFGYKTDAGMHQHDRGR